MGGVIEKVGSVSLRERPPEGCGDLSLIPEDLVRMAEESSRREKESDLFAVVVTSTTPVN
ncbi:hypothetical protein HS1genome_1785 [Sulfodiicoccus acidiphilus]|uniref:Uncharacterized protein n=1 Tax=Sulfodiicoccus acidiphilus TaxID=1670455 RepID=A0A348B5E4_9CREN|nr:hypothetical protein [Sulfodiicoccus acidiphilus]BBD73396.1 hypothetical protein HS1genome_1785 [Sulfodiicoccus acidiphilus]GGT98825.1 hypothetical protein GCM10007116_15300 [Sulfodiicoccus acidiphilus]